MRIGCGRCAKFAASWRTLPCYLTCPPGRSPTPRAGFFSGVTGSVGPRQSIAGKERTFHRALTWTQDPAASHYRVPACFFQRLIIFGDLLAHSLTSV